MVAADAGGVPEIVIDGVTGFTVPPRDTERMSEAITYLLSNPDEARQMGKAGLERAKEIFDIHKTTCSMEEALLSAMDKRREPAQ